MTLSSKNIRCVALLSGGLDSVLAAALMKKQGVEVLGVCFDIGFGSTPRRHSGAPHPALQAAKSVGVPIEMIDISDDYPALLFNPPHGYGSAANPCVDCHIEMIRRAKKYMEERGARFLVTGEVMGQRPMSQKAHQLAIVARESGAEDILLRPLSAKKLKATLPEREGWVNREELFGISGRSRSGQLRMAREMGITEFSAPAGGCLLTEREFGAKFFDLVENKGKENISMADLRLLKAGRHFRINSQLKFVVGRDEVENNYLSAIAGNGYGTLEAADVTGALTIIDGAPTDEELAIIGAISARYGQGRGKPLITMKYFKDGMERGFDVKPMNVSEPERWKI